MQPSSVHQCARSIVSQGEHTGKGGLGEGEKQTFLGEVAEFADDLDLALSLGRLEELDLALELVFLLDRETGVVRYAVVVLSEVRDEYLYADSGDERY